MNMKLLGLGAIALMLMALFAQMDAAKTQGATLVFPELDAKLSNLEMMKITTLETAEVVTMKAGENGWLIEELSGYPVEFATFSSFLNRLARLEIAERKTAKPANHARLEVAGEGPGAGTRVTLGFRDDNAVVNLLVGVTAQSGGSFVRVDDNPQVLLTDKTLDVASDALSWINPVVMSVDAQRVQSVQIEGADDVLLTAIRDATTGEMVISDFPTERALKYSTITDELARVLVNLRLLDVKPYAPEQFVGAHLTTVTLDDGSIIQVQTVVDEQTYWVQIDRPDLAAWQFSISEYAWGELNKSLEDLLIPLEVSGES